MNRIKGAEVLLLVNRHGRVVVVPVTRRILNAKKVFENGAGPCDAGRLYR